MEKLAMIKQAEVNGVMAALLETELVKVASEEDFDAVTSCITDGLSDDYDMEEVLAKTAEVLDEYYALCEEGEEAGEVKKEASEEGVDETAVMAAIGELTLAKVAGDISEEDYDAEVEKLAGAKFDALKNLGKSAKGKASNLGAFLSSGAKGKGIKQGFGKAKGNLGLAKKYKGNAKLKGIYFDGAKEGLKEGGKSLGRSVAVYGGAGLGGKALYEKYKK